MTAKTRRRHSAEFQANAVRKLNEPGQSAQALADELEVRPSLLYRWRRAAQAKLKVLGVSPSFSRSRVSNDNPYSEALFRTLKYRPTFPSRPFADIHAAIAWVARFVEWYNTKHLHSAINFVTPDDRHFGRHLKILSARSRVYEAARRRHPERWSGKTRNWEPIRVVCLNPEYDNASSKSKAKHA